LIDYKVPQVKLVDRTFNADPARARAIFRFIIEHNRSSRFHFEIAAHLLDDETLALLETVPPGVFQFEIGVQSTRDETLRAVDRPAALERLEQAVRRLKAAGRVHLHLDLVAGLPGEGYGGFLDSVDRVAALCPDHLQVEPVKLLPGTPLRERAAQLGLRFDPNPPYTVLTTPELSFAQLERLRAISRLLDLTCCAPTFLAALNEISGSLARGLEQLAIDLVGRGWLRFPLGREGLFLQLAGAVARRWEGYAAERLREALAYDLAAYDEQAATWVSDEVRNATAAIRGQGIKLQYFAAVFRHLPDTAGRTVCLFLYRTRSGAGMTVEERRLADSSRCG
jgi:anaerobic magnesium-protoporphyrin IX monomethyl ester cyclase